MRRWMQIRQYMVYFLFAVLLITAGGLGLDEKRQVLFACGHSGDCTVSKQIFTVSNDLHTIELRDDTSSVSSIRGMKSGKSGQQEQRNFMVLLFAIMFAYFYGLHPLCMQYIETILAVRMQIVRFMHDMDGRKWDFVSQ